MAKKSWIWNKFYGGLGDYSNIISGADMIKYGNESYSIDGRKNPEGVQLGQYLTTGEYQVSGDITAYLDLADFGGTGIVTITKTGNVYLNQTLKHTFTGGSAEIYDLSVLTISGTQYIYYFGPYGIHRSNMTCTTFIQDHRTFINQGYAKTKIINIENNIYFTSYNHLNTLDSSEIVTQGIFILSRPYVITGITLYQDYLRVYGKSATNGILSLWQLDSPSALANNVVIYPGLPIRGVTGDSGVDYAIMGFNDDYSDLYVINGLSKPVFLISNPEGNVNNRKFNGIIERRSGLMYLGGEIHGNSCIFSYGNYHIGYPDSLQVEGYTGTITAIYPRSNDILFGNNVGGTFPTRSGIQYIGNNNGYHKYNDIGYISSLVFTGGIRNAKTIINCEIYFNNDTLDTYNKFGGVVTLYARTKKSSARVMVRSFDTTTITDGFVNISKPQFGVMGNYNQIELRLKLEAGLVLGEYKISPLVTTIILNYDDNLKIGQ